MCYAREWLATAIQDIKDKLGAGMQQTAKSYQTAMAGQN